MQLRPEFKDYVSRKLYLPTQCVVEGARPFDLPAGQAEERLQQECETATRMLEMDKDLYHQDRQALYAALPPDPGKHPEMAHFRLRGLAEEQLRFRVVEERVEDGPPGIFSTVLCQAPATVDEFDPQGPALARPKAVLFVDTTPGEPGATVYFHSLVDLYPQLDAEHTRASHESVRPDRARLRPAVAERLERMKSAVALHRLGGNGAADASYCLVDAAGTPVGAVRIELEGTDPFRGPIPGVDKTQGRVSLAVHPDQVHAEQIELDGEERKALLENILATGSPTPDRQAATDALQALVADGDLGFYERAVEQLGDEGSWLGRMRAGEPPSRVF
ncbi:MAG: hypothetical protein AB7S38_12750 [Vulcanimicrobiota bacterium]